MSRRASAGLAAGAFSVVLSAGLGAGWLAGLGIGTPIASVPPTGRTGPPVVVLPASPSRHLPPSRPAMAAGSSQPGQRENLLAATGPAAGAPIPTPAPTVTVTAPAPSPSPSPSATPSPLVSARAKVAGLYVSAQIGTPHG